MRLKECDAYSISSRKYFTPSDPRQSTHYLDIPGVNDNYYSKDSSNVDSLGEQDCLSHLLSQGSVSNRFTPIYLTESEYRLTSGHNKIRLQRPSHLPKNSYIYLKQVFNSRPNHVVLKLN